MSKRIHNFKSNPELEHVVRVRDGDDKTDLLNSSYFTKRPLVTLYIFPRDSFYNLCCTQINACVVFKVI